MTFPTIPAGQYADQPIGVYANLIAYLNAVATSADASATGLAGAVVTAPSAGSPQTITAGAAGDTGLIIKGAASQSSAFQLWTDSTGTAVAGMYPSSSDARVGFRYWTNIANTNVLADLSGAGLVLTNRTTTANNILTVKGMASQSGDYFRAVDSGDVIRASVISIGADAALTSRYWTAPSNAGGVYLDLGAGSGTANTALLMNRHTVTNVVATIRGMASQSGDLLQLQNSAAAVLAAFAADGTPYTAAGIGFKVGGTGVTNAAAGAAALTVSGMSASTTPVVIKANASQSANLLEVNSSANATLASVSSAGLGTFAGLTSNGTVAVTRTVNDAQLTLDRSAGYSGQIVTRTSGSNRWILQLGNSTAESGANAGTDLALYSYTDAGAFLASPLVITRATSSASFAGDISVTKATGAAQVGINSSASGTSALVLNRSAGNSAQLIGRTLSYNRWILQLGNGVTESGSNAGSDFLLSCYDDAGTFIGSPFGVTRSTGAVTVTAAAATTIPLTVKGAASQSGDLTRWRDSSNAVLASVSAAGLATFAGLTSTGTVITAASTTARAGLRLPHGAAPTTGLTDGDIWTTTGGVYARINGATVGPFGTGGGGGAVSSVNGYTGAVSLTAADVSAAALAGATFSGAVSVPLLTIGTMSYSPTNPLATFQANVNSYSQFVIQNTNAGATASSDVIVNNDISTDTTTYGDLGINSSGFTGAGSLQLPNATYLYATGGELVLGTYSANGIRMTANNATVDALAISSANRVTMAQPIAAQTTTYTVTLADHTITADATGGAFAVTLPTAASASGRVFNIKKVDATANAVTLTGNGAETIDGANTQVISAQYASIQVQSNGSVWWII